MPNGLLDHRLWGSPGRLTLGVIPWRSVSWTGFGGWLQHVIVTIADGI